MKERSIIRFEQGIKSRQTLNNYRDHLKHFKNFAKFENYDSLIIKSVEEIQTLVEDSNPHQRESSSKFGSNLDAWYKAFLCDE